MKVISKKKNILVFSGKRGGYGALKPLLRMLESNESINLDLVLSDQHINPFFGNTQSEVAKDFPKYSILEMNQTSSKTSSRVYALSELLASSSHYLKTKRPDLAILYGDRGEVLTLAVALVHFKIPIAHIQGGDSSGNIDDLFRNAITHLSNFHFPSCKTSKEKLINLGIQESLIYTVGDCHLDEIYYENFPDIKEVEKKLDIMNLKDYAIFLLHPDTINKVDYENVLPPILNYLSSIFDNLIAIYPCSDPGYYEITKTLEVVRNKDNVHVYENLEAPIFWSLMKSAKLFIGNSSAGIIETSAFKLPTVNIGQRQQGRLRPKHVIESEFDMDAIKKAIEKAKRFDFKYIDCPYGEGKANEKIYKWICEYTNKL